MLTGDQEILAWWRETFSHPRLAALASFTGSTLPPGAGCRLRSNRWPTSPARAGPRSSWVGTASGGSAPATIGIVYEIHDDVLLVLVVAVGHRRDINQNR